jgi:hypothetical protein
MSFNALHVVSKRMVRPHNWLLCSPLEGAGGYLPTQMSEPLIYFQAKSRARCKIKYSTRKTRQELSQALGLHKTRMRSWIRRYCNPAKICKIRLSQQEQLMIEEVDDEGECKSISKASFIRMFQNQSCLFPLYLFRIARRGFEVRSSKYLKGQHTEYQNWLVDFSIMTLSNKFQIQSIRGNGVLGLTDTQFLCSFHALLL